MFKAQYNTGRWITIYADTPNYASKIASRWARKGEVVRLIINEGSL